MKNSLLHFASSLSLPANYITKPHEVGQIIMWYNKPGKVLLKEHMMNAAFPTTTSYEHIRLDDKGIPHIAGTTMKVVELVMAQKAYGWSPEELHFQHPYLTMSQIHSALAYYWEHKETLDADIERRLDYADQSRQEAGTSPLTARLRDQGLLE